MKKKVKDLTLEECITLCECIEQELKQAQKDKEMLDIFKNAITIERQIPPELEIKESEKGSSYVFREAVKIHENRIEEMLKKSLREWVLKNAFPEELKRLEELEKAFDALSKDDEKAKKLLSLEIEKNRAFEIIKDKQVNCYDIINSVDYKHYLVLMKNYDKSWLLTQEEYDFLKEELL